MLNFTCKFHSLSTNNQIILFNLFILRISSMSVYLHRSCPSLSCVHLTHSQICVLFFLNYYHHTHIHTHTRFEYGHCTNSFSNDEVGFLLNLSYSNSFQLNLILKFEIVKMFEKAKGKRVNTILP